MAYRPLPPLPTYDTNRGRSADIPDVLITGCSNESLHNIDTIQNIIPGIRLSSNTTSNESIYEDTYLDITEFSTTDGFSSNTSIYEDTFLDLPSSSSRGGSVSNCSLYEDAYPNTPGGDMKGYLKPRHKSCNTSTESLYSFRTAGSRLTDPFLSNDSIFQDDGRIRSLDSVATEGSSTNSLDWIRNPCSIKTPDSFTDNDHGSTDSKMSFYWDSYLLGYPTACSSAEYFTSSKDSINNVGVPRRRVTPYPMHTPDGSFDSLLPDGMSDGISDGIASRGSTYEVCC